jgi:hypothetical protein
MVSRRRGRIILATLGAVIIAAMVWFEGSLVLTRHKAGKLLRDVQAMKLGESTLEDVRRLQKQYGGISQKENGSVCSGDDCSFYGIPIYNWALEKGLALRWRVLHASAVWCNPCCDLAPWRVLWVGIYVKGGPVIRIEVFIHSRGSDGFIRAGHVQIVSQMPHGREPVRTGYCVYPFHMTTPGGGKGIAATIAPGASARDRLRAFQINLRCVTTLRGCREREEIMPAVWEDHEEYLRLHQSSR